MILEQLFHVKTNSCKMYAGVSLHDKTIKVSPLLSYFSKKSGSIDRKFIGVFEVTPGGLVLSRRKITFSQAWLCTLSKESQYTIKYMTVIPQLGSLCFFE